jgi:UDP-glucose 4-epimerase
MQEIWISSRDEFKQEVMRKELYDSPVKYYLGDVRDRASVDPAMERAALKEVLSCEFFPIQAVMTHTSIGPRRVIAGD